MNELRANQLPSIKANQLYFELISQPIINLLSTNQFSSFEILTRFYTQEGKMILPEEIFKQTLRSAEELQTLDTIIVNAALEKISPLSKPSFFRELPYYAINVTKATVEDGSTYLQNVKNRVKELSIDPRSIAFEIHEESDRGIEAFIKEAIEYGFRCSIDDMGTHYFPISKLHERVLPVISTDTKLTTKIDKSVIHQLMNEKEYEQHAEAQRVIEELLSIKSTYRNLSIVAEGVEDAITLRSLYKLGVDYIQGYFISKPTKF